MQIFTAKSLYMFRVSQHPSSGVLKTVTAASDTGHNIGTATSLQRGLIRPRWREVAVPEAAVTVTAASGTATSLQRGLIGTEFKKKKKCLHLFTFYLL